jgi:hypothetical protein
MLVLISVLVSCSTSSLEINRAHDTALGERLPVSSPIGNVGVGSC